MAERKKIILDLGIGGGGEYIRRDPPDVRRIGIDKSIEVSIAVAKYGVEADNNPIWDKGTKTFHLKYPDESISGIETIFPDDELLFGLSEPKSGLWQELG